MTLHIPPTDAVNPGSWSGMESRQSSSMPGWNPSAWVGGWIWGWDLEHRGASSNKITAFVFHAELQAGRQSIGRLLMFAGQSFRSLGRYISRHDAPDRHSVAVDHKIHSDREAGKTSRRTTRRVCCKV